MGAIVLAALLCCVGRSGIVLYAIVLCAIAFYCSLFVSACPENCTLSRPCYS